MFEWNNNYSVAIPSVDAQHRNLFAIARELHAAMDAGQGKASLGRILDRLVQYTTVHFAHEERLLRMHNYPDFAAHKAEPVRAHEQIRRERRTARLATARAVTVVCPDRSFLQLVANRSA